MFEEAIRALEAAPRIILHRHSHPDGDAIGSQLGLRELLRANFPDKEILVVGDPAGRFSFLENSAMDEPEDAAWEGALAVVLDSAAEHLISDLRYRNAASTLRIDHHLFCGKLCGLEVVDSSFESCAGMIALLAREAGWKLTLPAATAIYMGMCTDSGRFRYDATSSRTFMLASWLMEQPIDLTALYSKLYSDTLENLKLRSSFIARIAVTEHRVAWLYNTLEQVRESGLEPAAVSRGMVGTMSDLAGIPIWVNFTEVADGVDCELRSSLHNINPIAVKYGGGGHQKASGAHVPDRETAMAMLADLDEMLK